MNEIAKYGDMINEIKEVLAKMGIHLGMETPGWPPENIEELIKRCDEHF